MKAPVNTAPGDASDPVHRDRAWWRGEARRSRTDWSSLLRQRIKVLAWVRAGRPPLAQWNRSMPEAVRLAEAVEQQGRDQDIIPGDCT